MLGAMQRFLLDRLLSPVETVVKTHLRICCFLCPPGLYGCIMKLGNVLDESCKVFVTEIMKSMVWAG